MGRIGFALLSAALFACIATTDARAQQNITFENCPELSATQVGRLTEEHVFGGPPSGDALLVRRPYVMTYDEGHRVPRWVAWHAIAEYRRTPSRTGKWKAFRGDVDVANPVVDDDYDGLLSTSRNIARGHLAPYFISGGDRDVDGRLATRDIDDACTVFEINLMSNVAPQFHDRFNGAGGLWGKLESRLRTALGRGQSFQIIAGTIFGDAPDLVGPDHDIAVPNMFFQIVVSQEEVVVPFLFGHPSVLGEGGCPLRRGQRLEACIATVAEIEELSGLDFFGGFVSADEQRLESQDGAANWQAIIARRGP